MVEKKLDACDFKSPMHPDGKPWAKCCGDKKSCQCAFRRYPADYGLCLSYQQGRFKRNNDNRTDTKPFLCHHRTDDGYLRICAGWHAMYGKGRTYAPDTPEGRLSEGHSL